MERLTQGRVLVTNWHVFEPQSVQTGGEQRQGRKRACRCGDRRPSASGRRRPRRGAALPHREGLQRQVAPGLLKVLEGRPGLAEGTCKKVYVEAVKYVESDTALVNRVLGRESAASKTSW